ncbi:hypothetical protein QBC45DRAFT_441422 [Copromyces sp. CBS 386.78]|nr:hypothetical protein QBC45DRAFT_441422 [Copromyces sp. CBS 386.78]
MPTNLQVSVRAAASCIPSLCSSTLPSADRSRIPSDLRPKTAPLLPVLLQVGRRLRASLEPTSQLSITASHFNLWCGRPACELKAPLLLSLSTGVESSGQRPQAGSGWAAFVPTEVVLLLRVPLMPSPLQPRPHLPEPRKAHDDSEASCFLPVCFLLWQGSPSSKASPEVEARAVDPVALNIPTYHKVVKKPMDLATLLWYRQIQILHDSKHRGIEVGNVKLNQHHGTAEPKVSSPTSPASPPVGSVFALLSQDTSTVAAGATVSRVQSTEQEALSSASSSANSGSSAATRALFPFWVINIPEHSLLGIEEKAPKKPALAAHPPERRLHSLQSSTPRATSTNWMSRHSWMSIAAMVREALQEQWSSFDDDYAIDNDDGEPGPPFYPGMNMYQQQSNRTNAHVHDRHHLAVALIASLLQSRQLHLSGHDAAQICHGFEDDVEKYAKARDYWTSSTDVLGPQPSP